MKQLKKILIQPKSIVLIFLVTAILVITSALIELNQSRKETLELMNKQSHSLLETLLASSSNALLSSERIEEELRSRLLNNAALIKMMFEKGLVTNSFLQRIAAENNIYRINIFNRQGNKLFSSSDENHSGMVENASPIDNLYPIFNGDEDTLIVGVKPARFIEGNRYAVAIATKERGAVVLNVDAEELLKLRTRLGFGVLLREISQNSNIIYAVLQDEDNIIAAAGNTALVDFLDSTKIALNTAGNYSYVLLNKNGTDIFEARHLFNYQGIPVGAFRVGLSMEPINNLNGRAAQRIVVVSILLIVLGSIAFAFIFIRQNYLLLSRKFSSLKEYSNTIVDNIEDAIILLDEGNVVISANTKVKSLFGEEPENITGRPVLELLDGICRGALESSSTVSETSCTIGGKLKTFLISKSSYSDEHGKENRILVIKDLTGIKEMEKQVERQNRLAAMGELASSVAHEIRNPLNAISTIVQQLNKDFRPAEGIDEYQSLTGLVYGEVKRINTTIESFLKFARPVEMSPEPFKLNDLLNQLTKQYSRIAEKREIRFSTKCPYDCEVIWDRNQIIQAFINIIENAFDAVSAGGSISVSCSGKEKDLIVVSISDTGNGIGPEEIERIFNLYYTTKKKGSGIGLSIVQKIVDAHGGTIGVESAPGAGTTFHITLPKSV